MPFFEAEALDIQQTVGVVEGLKAQAELYRNNQFQSGQRPPAPDKVLDQEMKISVLCSSH